MKISRLFPVCLLLFTLAPAWGQSPPAPANKQSELAYFDLDFPGGTPRDLVNAIQKAAHHPLNAVIPEELANTKLPAVKMSNITVPDLFRAMYLASQKQESYITGRTEGPFGGGPSWATYNATCGFTTADARVTDDSIWYFHSDKPALPPSKPEKTCRFYQLTHYLDMGYSVDDITTAAETAWKMEKKTSPLLTYHKDTGLLVAIGDPSDLDVIDDVLRNIYKVPKPGPDGKSVQQAKPSANPPQE